MNETNVGFYEQVINDTNHRMKLFSRSKG